MSLKFFTYEEFDSPDLPNSGRSNMDADFLELLDNAREIAGIPFKINSGFRTKEHNNSIYEKLGKKPIASSHLIGKAVDIATKGSQDRWIILTALQKAGFNRFGIGKSFIHVDSDGIDKGGNKVSNVIWTY